jgi:hypothetical protein
MDTNPVRRNLEYIFEEGDSPAQEDDQEERFPVHILQVAIPGKSHE